MPIKLGTGSINAMYLGSTAISAAYLGAGQVFGGAPYTPTDADAAAYITAVETADGQTLENGVRQAIDDFVIGCKADGIWAAIKASCILAGARTLSGALVPLVGSAPTNFNFVSGDYNRKTGLKGDGSTKYLDSNRNNNADGQNNNHNAVFVTVLPATAERNVIGIGGQTIGANTLQITAIDGSSFAVRSRATLVATFTRTAGAVDLLSSARSASGQVVVRARGSNSTLGQVSQTTLAGNVEVFKTTATNHTDARLSFYSIGESLDLALLDARVSALMTAIDGAI